MQIGRVMSAVLAVPLLTLSAVAVAATPASAATYDVGAYGAVGDGTTLDTAAIQRAVQAARDAGGGTVVFASGRTYKVTTVVLKSMVTLNLNGATLKASDNQADWTRSDRPVLFAESRHDLAVTGPGTIDGGGGRYYKSDGEVVAGNRPENIIHIRNSTRVSIRNVNLRNSVKWTVRLVQDDHVTVDGVTIRNPEWALAKESDGLTLVGSRHVVARNLDIETGDDAVCIKGDPDPYQNPHRASYDIVVSDSTLASTTNATKIGTNTTDEIRDVTFRNITVNKHSRVTTDRNPVPTGESISAVSLQSNDGGAVHDITVDRYTVNNTATPIFLEQQDRESSTPGKPVGPFYNVSISNVDVRRSIAASQINVCDASVNPLCHIDNVTLENITTRNYETSNSTSLPFHPDGRYPDAHVYGPMPAYGLFARNVRGLKLTGTIRWGNEGGSTRPATRFENVTMR